MLFNGVLAHYTSPVWSSFVAHAVGSVLALVVIIGFFRKRHKHPKPVPKAYYLSGVFGALIVIIANITVNSEIGVSGSIALLLLGQIVFGMVIDRHGWFGMAKRPITLPQLLGVVLVLSGCYTILFLAR